MDKIAEAIKKDYLKIDDYYNFSFEIFKKLISRNKWLTFLFFSINFIIKLLAENSRGLTKIIELLETSDLLIIEKMWASFNMTIILSIISLVIGAVFMKKMMLQLEKGENLNFWDLFFKVIKLLSIVLALTVCITTVLSIIWIIALLIFFLVTDTKEFTVESLNKFSTVNLAMQFTGLLMVVYLIMNMLYFPQTYYLRNINMYEAFNYNRHLCKGNRLKIVFSILILTILRILLVIPLVILSAVTVFSNYKFLIMIVSAVWSCVFELFSYILASLVYLNVEYMDLKKI